jgi:hypothetical protein
MSRKPTDTAHVNLRIRESLRKKLADEAEDRHWSLNNEIRWRLEASFERQDLLSLADTASGLETVVLRFSQQFHELGKQGDLLRAAEALVKAIEQNDPDAIKDGVIRVRQTINMIETEAKAIPRRMHTGGGKL